MKALTATDRRRVAVIGNTGRWHGGQLRTAADRHGVDLMMFDYEQLSFDGSVRLGDADGRRFDAILTRTMPAASMELLTLRLSMLHELSSDVPVINSAASLELAIDKYRTVSIAGRLGLPVPATAVAQDRSTAMAHFDNLGGDVVVKPIFGGEGRGVMRVRDRELAWTVFSSLQISGLIIHQQRFVPPGGSDRRVLIIGDHVVSLRRRNQNDFRTNVSAGGHVERIADDAELTANSRSLMSAMGLTIAAVDWIDDSHGEPMLIECNAIPGWRQAQSVCDHSIAAEILKVVT